MADASGLVDCPEQNGGELTSSLSNPQDVLDFKQVTESAQQLPGKGEVLSPSLNVSEGDDEVEVKEAASANEDLSTSEAETSSFPSAATLNSPPDLAGGEEIRKEEAEEEGKKEGRRESEWLDVLGSGQLLKKTLRAGEGVSTRPTPQCQVKMKVKGTIPSGACVDRHGSLSFIVGDGDVIQAIDITASLMERGEVCCVKTDPRFAYGATGRSPSIPPNTSLMYELELMDVKEPLDLSSISLKELLAQLNKKRGRGNDLFQRKEFDQAVNSYNRAVQMMKTYQEEQHVSELSGELRDLWIRCLNNLAAAQLKVEQHNEALESVEAVLKTDPENVKALYRCGKIHLNKREPDLAVEFLKKAANLSTEKAIHTELQKAIRKRDQQNKDEKEMYRLMMGGVLQQPKATTRGSSNLSAKKSPQANWGWGRLLLGAGIAAMVAAGIAWLAYRYRKVPH